MKTETFPKTPGISTEWGGGEWGTEAPVALSQYGTWESPPVNSYNSYDTTGVGFGDSAWGTPSSVEEWGDDSVTSMGETAPQSSERLHNLKNIAQGMGRKALDAVMNRLPSFNGQKDILMNKITSTGKEAAQVGLRAARNELMSSTGMEINDGRLSVASKRKLAATAFRLVRNPYLEGANLARKSTQAGVGAARGTLAW